MRDKLTQVVEFVEGLLRPEVRWPIAAVAATSLLLVVVFKRRHALARVIVDPSRAPVPWIAAFVVLIILGYVPWAKTRLSDVAWYPGATESTSLVLSILTGIGAVIVAVAIFLAEQFRLGRSSTAGRAFVMHSGAYPVTLAAVGVLIVILVHGQATVLDGVVVLALGIGVTTVVYRFFRALLDPDVAWTARLRLLRERVRAATSDLVELRRREARFAEWLQQHKGTVEYAPLMPKHEEDALAPVHSTSDGIVGEIGGSVLDRLVELLKREATPSTHGKEADSEPRPEALIQPRPQPLGYVLIRPGQPLRKGDPIGAIRVPADDGEAPIRKATALLVSALNLQSPRRTEAHYFKNDMQELEEQFQSAISSGRPTDLEQAEEQYFAVVGEFLGVLSEAGIRDSLGARGFEHILQRPEGELVGDVFHELMRHVLEAGLRADTLSIVQGVAALPIGTMYRAQKAENYGMASEFARYHEALFEYALQRPGRIGDYLLDRSWRHLKEFLDWRLTPRLQETVGARGDELERLFIQCLSVFGRVLKRCVDNDRPDDLRELLKRISPLRVDDIVGKAVLRRHLSEERDDEAPLGEASDRLERLVQARREVIIGIAAWTLYKRERDDTPPRWDSMLTEVLDALPGDTDVLSQCLVRAMTFETADAWGWDDWELWDHDDGQMHRIGVADRVSRLFVVAVLRRLPTTESKDEPALYIGRDRDFPLSIDNAQSGLNTFLAEVEKNPAQWEAVIGENVPGRLEVLKRRLAATLEAYRKREAEEIAGRGLDPEMVDEVITATILERDRVSVWRYLWAPMDDSDIPEVRIERRDAGLILSQVMPKDAFFKDWYRHYSGLGDGFGRSIARGEDQLVYRKLLDAVHEERGYASLDGLLEAMQTWMEERPAGHRWVVVAPHGFTSGRAFWEHSAFTPQWRMPRSASDTGRVADSLLSVAGIDVELYELPFRDEGPAFLLSPAETGTPRTCRPTPGGSYTGAVSRGGVLFWVRDLNDDTGLRDEILRQLPQWLQAHPEAQRKMHLRRQALFEVREMLDFEVAAEPQAVRLVRRNPDANGPSTE